MFRQMAKTLRRWLAGIINRLKLNSLQEWISVLLVFITLGIAARSIEQARWIKPQPSLILVLFLAVITALILAKSQMRKKITYPLAVVLGLGVMVWQSVGLVPQLQGQSALQSWWSAVSTLQLNEGTLFFGIFLIAITWLIGLISTRFVLRKQNAWMTVFIGTVMVLINLSNLPRNYYYFLPLYLVSALLLIGQVNLAKQATPFNKREVGYPRRGITYFMVAVLSISVLTVITAWFVPEPPVDQIKLVSASGELSRTDSDDSWFNIFADVPAKWTVIESSEQDTLYFGDEIGSGGKVLFVISSNRTGYWRTRRYDTYHGWGWTSSIDSERALNPGETASDAAVPDDDVLTYTVENRLKTDVILSGGEIQSVDIPVVLNTLSANTSTGESLINDAERLTETEAENTTDGGEDVITVVSEQLITPYQSYTVTSHLNSVTPEELEQASDDYDQWVTDYYLQLPDSLPYNVRVISRGLTRGKETPYEKVVAIKEFLNGFEYVREIEPPPEGEDGVACFLDTDKKGNCVNFASVMVVMLRSAGVPARLCTGYFRGELDTDAGNLLIRVRNKHAWVEVYFNDYGWIEFEATPSSEQEDEDEVIFITGNSFQYLDELYYYMEMNQPVESGGVIPSGNVRARESGIKFYQYVAIIGIPILLFIAARLAIARWTGRLQRIENAFEAYEKMCYLASLGKVGRAAQETPLEYGTRLALAIPAQAETINNIVQAYVDTRYSPRKELERMETIRLQTSWVRLSEWLIKRLLRLRRS